MKSILLSSATLFLSIVFSSCYRIPDKPIPQRPQLQNATTPTSVSSEKQQVIKEQREKMAKLEKKKNTSIAPKKQTDEIKKKVEAPVEKPAEKPAAPKRKEYSFASRVPGKPGFVFSPYNNELVDVRDIPSGTLVQDPTYPAAEKKYFRVP